MASDKTITVLHCSTSSLCHMKFVLPVIFIILFLSFESKAQVTKAAEFMSKGNYSEAAALYEKAREKNNADYNDLTNLAFCYIMLRDMPAAAKVFELIVADKKVEPIQHFYYGEVLRILGDFEAAKAQYRTYSTKVPSDYRAIQRIASCDSLPFWKSHPTKYQVSNAGDINSPGEEMYPWIYQDKLYYTSNNRALLSKTGRSCSFSDPSISFIFCKSENSLSSIVPVSSDSLSYHMYALRKNIGLLIAKSIRKTSNGEALGSSKIMLANSEGNWSDFRLAQIPEGFVMSQPCLNQTDTRMYFVSDMPGGMGGTDLYYTDYLNGTWSAPVNLGKDINTIGNEMFPVLSNHDSCLYFSSDGLPGFGNLDIFKCSLINNNWSAPVNMRSPINSFGNDFGFVFGKSNHEGYFVSNRSDGSHGGHDIYSFILPEPIIIKPDTVKKDTLFYASADDIQFVFFKTGNALIDGHYLHMLDSVANLMLRHPYLKLNLTSFADARGPEGLNTNLIDQRSKSILHYFESKSINPSRIITKTGAIESKYDFEFIQYHVQIGYLSHADGIAYYEYLLQNSLEVKTLPVKNGYSYFVGDGSLIEMRALSAQIKTKFGIDCFIVGSCMNKMLEDIYYAPNRRTEIYLFN